MTLLHVSSRVLDVVGKAIPFPLLPFLLVMKVLSCSISKTVGGGLGRREDQG